MSLDHDLVENLVGAFADPWATGEPNPAELWSNYVALDLPGVGIAEDQGGSGGDLADVVSLAFAAGRSALPLQVVEDHLARWLLSEAGRAADSRPRSIALGESSLHSNSGRLSGQTRHVPYTDADPLLTALWPDLPQAELFAAELRLDDLGLERRSDLAGQTVADVTLTDVPCDVARTGLTRADLQTRGRLLRAAQMAGAIQTIAQSTLDYVRTREQFGVPIGSFQSVQAHVVHLEQAATFTLHAVETATLTGSPMDADAAWLVALDQASSAVAAAHQVHGAIGMTMEFHLQRYTRRLHAWRWDFGCRDEVEARLAEPAFSPKVGVGGVLSGISSHDRSE